MTTNLYLGTIDAGGDGRAILLAAINTELGTNYTLTDFDFGVPSLVDVPNPTHNSQIAFGPKLGTGYYGVRTIFYNRVHATALGTVIVPFSGEMYISEILPKINHKYGIFIDITDIYDAAITPPAQGVSQVSVTLSFRPESVIFYGGVAITVGQNDPTGDTAPSLPFESFHTFVFNQVQDFTLDGQEQVLLEPFSLSVDRNRVRKSTALLGHDLFANNAAAHLRVRMTRAQYATRAKNVPFVGMWTEPVTGRVMGVGPQGSVYQASLDGTSWDYLANALGYDITNPAVVTNAYDTPSVKAVVQGADGVTYFLAKGADGVARVYSTASSQTVWTALTISTTRMISLASASWDTLEVLDAVHHNGKLRLLIRSPQTYDFHPTKGNLTPALEILNTGNGTVNYFPLGETTVAYSGIALNVAHADARWSIVTPLASSAYVDVVALVPSVKNNNTYAVFYKETDAEYAASVLPHSFLGSASSLRAEMDIKAYQIAFSDLQAEVGGVAVTNHYLDVVEITAPTEVADLSRYFLKTGVRTQEKFLSYGVKVLTSVATRAARTPWFESQVNLTSSQKPVQVKLQCVGTRNHVLFQNTNAMHRVRFRQLTGTSQFTAELDSSVVLESHTGYAHVCTYGAGAFVPVTVIDSPVDKAYLTNDIDFEAALPDIGYSFVAKTAAGAYQWLTATAVNTALEVRAPSRNYAFMGETPCLVASEGSALLYWSSTGSGLFKSTNAGKSWNEFNAAPVFYHQERTAVPTLQILGMSDLKIKAEQFLESTLVSGRLLVETKLETDALVYDVVTGLSNQPRQFTDHMLFDVSAFTTQNQYTFSGVQYGFGLNALSSVSPRSVVAWDSDAQNNFETIGYHTTDVTAPLAVKHNFDNYMFTLPGRLVDFSRDVRYLGYRHWILVENAGVWNLHFTNVVLPEKTIGLFGSDSLTLSTFLPEVNFHLWDHEDVGQSYIPYVFYGNKRVLLLERLAQDLTFTATHHILNIPDDNGQPLLPLRMHTANRRDYLFTQKGNGIFRLTYAWDGITRVSTVVLQKIFSLVAGAVSGLTFLSGCQVGVAAHQAPAEVLVPDKLAADLVIGWYCNGTTRVNRFADGLGGYYETTVVNSFDCGYVVPVIPGQPGGFGGGA